MRYIIVLLVVLSIVSYGSSESCKCGRKSTSCTVYCAFCQGCMARSICNVISSNIRYWNETDMIRHNGTVLSPNILYNISDSPKNRCAQPGISDWSVYGGSKYGQCNVRGGTYKYNCSVCKEECQTSAICVYAKAKIMDVYRVVWNNTQTYTHAKNIVTYCYPPPKPQSLPYSGTFRNVNMNMLVEYCMFLIFVSFVVKYCI